MVFSFAANLNSTCTMWFSPSTFNIVKSKCFNSPTGGSVSVFHLMLRSSKLYGVIGVASFCGMSRGQCGKGNPAAAAPVNPREVRDERYRSHLADFDHPGQFRPGGGG